MVGEYINKCFSRIRTSFSTSTPGLRQVLAMLPPPGIGSVKDFCCTYKCRGIYLQIGLASQAITHNDWERCLVIMRNQIGYCIYIALQSELWASSKGLLPLAQIRLRARNHVYLGEPPYCNIFPTIRKAPGGLIHKGRRPCIKNTWQSMIFSNT